MRHPKPKIITLQDHLQINRTLDVQKRNFPSKNRNLPNTEYLRNPRSKHFVINDAELDVEFKNDFKWLINFNLKSILPYDLDEEFCDGSKAENYKQMNFYKNKITGNFHSRTRIRKTVFPVIEEKMIEECLLENNELTVKSIFKWIREHNQGIKAEDRKWKKAVRMILLNNPIFRIKKSRTGKQNVWYLHKNSYKDARSSKTQKQESLLMNLEVNKGEIQSKMDSIVCSPAKEYFNLYGSNHYAQENIVPTYLESWFDQGFEEKEYVKVVKQEDPIESYEIEIPLESEFLENEKYAPIEVPFLNEDTCSLFI